MDLSCAANFDCSAECDRRHGAERAGVAARSRERFPRATIGWIVEKTSAQLLRGHADLDHLIVVPSVG